MTDTRIETSSYKGYRIAKTVFAHFDGYHQKFTVLSVEVQDSQGGFVATATTVAGARKKIDSLVRRAK